MINHTRIIKLIACFSIFYLLATGCKKNRGNELDGGDNQSGIYDFTWSDEPVESQPITFYSTAPKTSKHSWNFGTDVGSTEVEPRCTYGQNGTYTVTLSIDNIVQSTRKIVVGKMFYIGWSGGPCVNDTLHFKNTPYPVANTYAWDFGDGSTSTLPTPYHVYSKPGRYTVKLTINNNHTARKDFTVYEDPLYTHKISGMRNWHVSERQQGAGIDTTRTKPGVTFEVQFVDKITVAYKFNSLSGFLKYNKDLSKGSVLVYGGYNNTLYFDHVQDTMRIIKVDGPGKLEGPYQWTTNAYTP